MQPIPWNDLQDFLVVARTRQLARAAAQLGVDATTVGRRLRRLEARLGRTLFEQTRDGQVLTEAGEALLAQVEDMQRAADRIAEPEAVGGGLSGLLRVSVSEGFGSWLVAAHLGDFAQRHPALTIDLVANSGFLQPSRREADVAVMLARPGRGPVIASKLGDYTLHVYAARDRVARLGSPDRTTLRRVHPLIGYIPDLLYSSELNYLHEIDPALSADIRSSSINAQARLIASGAGVGVLPGFIGESLSDVIRVMPDVTITRAFWLVTHRDTRQLRRVVAFRTWLTELLAENHRLLLPLCNT